MLPTPDGPFKTREIGLDPFVQLAPAHSPLRAQAPLALHTLAGFRLIGAHSCRATAAVEEDVRRHGDAEIALRSDDNETIRSLVAGGYSVALVPRLSVEPFDERLVALEIADSIAPRRIGLAWHRERQPTPAILTFIELARRRGLPGSRTPASGSSWI